MFKCNFMYVSVCTLKSQRLNSQLCQTLSVNHFLRQTPCETGIVVSALSGSCHRIHLLKFLKHLRCSENTV